MIFGAMILGSGVGFIAAAVALAMGANPISAFLIYCLAGVLSSAGICLAKTLFCRDAPAPKQTDSLI